MLRPLLTAWHRWYISFGLNIGRSIRDAFREYNAHYLMLQRKLALTPNTKADFVRVPMISLPVIPELISALNFITVNSLPLRLLARWIRRRREPFPTGFWFLVAAYVYAAGFSCLGEFSENMRYRLEIEPVIWILSMLIAIEWVKLARGYWAPPPAVRPKAPPRNSAGYPAPVATSARAPAAITGR